MRVDVVLPMFHAHERWLDEAVSSVLAQDHTDWSLYLVHDGPGDAEAVRIGRSWAARDTRINFLQTPRRMGPGQARMYALQRSAGDAVAFIDQDDRWKPAKLTRQTAGLETDPSLQALLTGVDHIDPGGRVLGREGSGDSPSSPEWDSTTTDPARLKRMVFLRHDGVHLVSALIRRDAFDRVGGFSPELRAAEDTDFWIRFVTLGMRFGRIRDGLIERRVHSGNTSRSPEWRAGHWDSLERILQENPDLVPVAGARRRNLLCEDAMNQMMAGDAQGTRRAALRMLEISATDYRAYALLFLSLVPRLGAAVVEPRLR